MVDGFENRWGFPQGVGAIDGLQGRSNKNWSGKTFLAIKARPYPAHNLFYNTIGFIHAFINSCCLKVHR